MKKFAAIAIACSVGLAPLAGCVQTRAERGAVVGGVTGAAVGALATRNVAGAAIGAGVGAVGGYIVGKNSYRCRKVNIFGQPYWGTCLR